MELCGKKILVVDDEEGFREILTEEFQDCGAEVISTSSGLSAFEVFKTVKFDAVVSDIRMPNGDGIYFLDQILNAKFILPVFVFITGYAEFDENEIKEKGVASVFTKPFEITKLVNFLATEMHSYDKA